MTAKDTVHSLEAARVRADIATKKASLRTGYDRKLELDIERLEQHVARLDDKHTRAVERAQQRDADEKQREQDARAELEQRLMDTYKQASPGTTEQEARDALPDLLHRHRLAAIDTRDAAITQAANRMRM